MLCVKKNAGLLMFVGGTAHSHRFSGQLGNSFQFFKKDLAIDFIIHMAAFLFIFFNFWVLTKFSTL
jgi:hypothetical protein